MFGTTRDARPRTREEAVRDVKVRHWGFTLSKILPNAEWRLEKSQDISFMRTAPFIAPLLGRTAVVDWEMRRLLEPLAGALHEEGVATIAGQARARDTAADAYLRVLAGIDKRASAAKSPPGSPRMLGIGQ